MGRKSNKAKEKKARRLEETALEDPLAAFPAFTKYNRNRLKPMKKMMLTVFKQNKGGYWFFRETLQFEIAKTSLSTSSCCDDNCSYEILSRRTKHDEALAGHTHGDGHYRGCCH
uniref:Uncharacterized protein n=1 Tax=Amphilophus citrinellus TaxID=61819 RepID=A0A3Q0RFU9_AMPCI